MKTAPFRTILTPGSSIRRCSQVRCAALSREVIVGLQPHFGSEAVDELKSKMFESENVKSMGDLGSQSVAILDRLKQIVSVDFSPEIEGLPAMSKSVKTFIKANYSFPEGPSEVLRESANYIVAGLTTGSSQHLESHWGSQAISQVADALTNSAAISLNHALGELVSRIPSS